MRCRLVAALSCPADRGSGKPGSGRQETQSPQERDHVRVCGSVIGENFRTRRTPQSSAQTHIMGGARRTADQADPRSGRNTEAGGSQGSVTCR